MRFVCADFQASERLREVRETLRFADLLSRLYDDKHTGPIVIHFAQGHPQSVELPAEPTRIRLDKSQR